MARAQDPTARSYGLIALATVGSLGVATALAFGRIFVGRAPTLRLLAAALMAIGIGWLTRRRGLFIATLASVAGLAFALTWLVYPQTAWYGLPSLRTLRAIGRSLEYVGQQTRTQVAPAPPLPPLLLAAVTAMWAASWSAYTLATRAGSPLLAILPPIALVGFADIVLEDGVRVIYAVLFLTAALAVAFSDGLRRIGQWGPVWRGPYRDRTVRSASGRSVRRVMLVAVGAAVLAPSLLPGFRSAALVDWAGEGSAVRIDPFVSIHSSLNRDDPVDMFRVTSEEGGAYWRLFALDTYTGSEWRMSDPNLGGAPEYPSPALLPGSWPEDAGTLNQRFEVLSDLGDRWVPMAFPAQTLTLGGGGVRYDSWTGIAQAPDPLEEGDEYTVISRRISPTPEQLDQVVFGSPGEYARYTFLPSNVAPEVRRLARRWTEDQTTAYGKIYAIQERFRSGEFLYDQEVEPTEDADELLRFLTETKTGFCQQFSVAMAVLVRELGYPARIAVGYRPGDPDGDTFTVDSHDAHSWVEVYFEGYGWLPFEPTPGRSNPVGVAGSYLNPGEATAPGAGQGELGPGAELPGGSGERGIPRPLRDLELGGPRRGGGGFDVPSPAPVLEEGPDYSIPYRLILEVVLLALAILAIAFPIAKWLWRSMMLHRSREPRELVLSIYRVFDGEAADIGLGRRDGETLAEYRDRLDSTVSFSDGHLSALTTTATRAAYSPDPIDREEAIAAARAARTAIRDMRRGAGLTRRLAGVYRPKL
jgi:transglutaminase-like putative cysteine protease